MKKSIRNIIIGAMATIGVLGASSAALANELYAQTDMNFRNGPSTTATVIGSVPAGAKVDVQGNENGWDLISYDGKTGFIHGGNVAAAYVAPAPQAQPTQTGNGDARTYFDNGFTQSATNVVNSGSATHVVTVQNGYLALRSQPTYDASNEIGRLFAGDTVDLVSATTDGSYVQVFSPKLNAYGYVNAGFIS